MISSPTWAKLHLTLHPLVRGEMSRILRSVVDRGQRRQWLRCAVVPFDPTGQRVFERGRDIDTGAVSGLLKPLDQVCADRGAQPGERWLRLWRQVYRHVTRDGRVDDFAQFRYLVEQRGEIVALYP